MTEEENSLVSEKGRLTVLTREADRLLDLAFDTHDSEESFRLIRKAFRLLAVRSRILAEEKSDHI